MWMKLTSTWLSCPSCTLGTRKHWCFPCHFLTSIQRSVASQPLGWFRYQIFELAKFWLGTLIQTYFAICLPIACQMMVKYVPPTRKKHRTANSTIGHIFPYFEICSYMFSSLSCHEVLSRQPLERQGTCQITVWLNKFWGRRGSDGRSVRNLESIGGVQSGTEGLNKKMGGWGDRINPQQNYVLYIYMYISIIVYIIISI